MTATDVTVAPTARPSTDAAPTEKSWLRGAAWISLAVLLVSASNYLFSLVMARLLPRAEFVAYVGAQSVLLIIGTGVMAAIPWVVSHEVATARSDPSAHSDRARRALVFGFKASIVQGLVVALVAGLICLHIGGQTLGLVAAVAAFALSLVAGPVGFLQGSERFATIAALRLGESVVRIGGGLVLVLVLSGSSAAAIAGMPLASLVLAVVALAYCLSGLTRRGGPLSRSDERAQSEASGHAGLAVRAARLGVVQLLVTVLASVDAIVAASSVLAGSEGYAYQTASLLGRAPLFVSLAMSQALFPVLVRHGDGVQGRQELRRATSVYLALGSLAILGFWTIPPALLRVVAGSAAEEVGALVAITGTAGALMGLASLVITSRQAWGAGRGLPLALAAVVVVEVVALTAAAHAGGRVFAQTTLACVAVLTVGVVLDARRRRARSVPAGRLVPSHLRWLPLGVLLVAAPVSAVDEVVAWFACVLAVAAAVLLLHVRAARATGVRPTGDATSTPEEVLRAQLHGIGSRRARHHRAPLVVMIGNVGNGNVGDDALFAVSLAAVRASGARVVAVSRDPDLARRTHDVEAVPMSARAAGGAVRRSDAVVVVGGGMFGPGLPPLVAVLPVVVLLLSWTRRDTAYLGIGAYDGMPWWTRAALRLSAGRSHGATVRDLASGQLLSAASPPPCIGDLALLLRSAPTPVAAAVLADAGVEPDRPLLVLAPKASLVPERTEAVLDLLTVAAAWWVAAGGRVVGLVLSEGTDHGIEASHTDRALLATVAERSGVAVTTLVDCVDPAVVKAVVGQADAVLGLRFHALVFATGTGVPAAGFAWEAKSAAFIEEHDLVDLAADQGEARLERWLTDCLPAADRGVPSW